MGLVVNHFPRIIAEIGPKTDEAIEAACVVIEQGAERRSRVLSGDMKADWHHEIFPGFSGRVWNGKEYAIYNEFGTRHMDAQPMARPAAQEAEIQFYTQLYEAFSA